MTTDIIYRDTDITGEKRTDVSFVEFVQLYINYRPAHGVSYKEMESAFKALTDRSEDSETETVSREAFVNNLCEKGEPLEMQQVHKYFCALMGEDRIFDPESPNFSFIPEVK